MEFATALEPASEVCTAQHATLQARSDAWHRVVNNGGSQISMREQRNKTHLDDPDVLQYDETPFATIIDLLDCIVLARAQFLRDDRVAAGCGGVFVDLGCGTGKVLVGAALFSGKFFSSGKATRGATYFSQCIGIEQPSALCAAASECARELIMPRAPVLTLDDGEMDDGDLSPRGVEKARAVLGADAASAAACQIRVLQGDLTDSSLAWTSTADVVFACSTCFNDDLLATILEHARALRHGSIFVTLRLTPWLARTHLAPWFTHTRIGPFPMSSSGEVIAHMLQRTEVPWP